jgi:hypothetical protein
MRRGRQKQHPEHWLYEATLLTVLIVGALLPQGAEPP